MDEAVRISSFRGFDSQNLAKKKYLWSSVRGLKVHEQPNYYGYFYSRESICSMSMKFRRKAVVVVVINLPKYFESHFDHVTRKRLITFIFFAQKWGTLILQNFEKV